MSAYMHERRLAEKSRYNDRHVQETILRRIDKVVAKHNAFYDKRNLDRPRFPHYEVSRPEAARLCAAADIRKPRVGYIVDLVYDADKDVTWEMHNKSGTFYLSAVYH